MFAYIRNEKTIILLQTIFLGPDSDVLLAELSYVWRLSSQRAEHLILGLRFEPRVGSEATSTFGGLVSTLCRQQLSSRRTAVPGSFPSPKGLGEAWGAHFELRLMSVEGILAA